MFKMEANNLKEGMRVCFNNNQGVVQVVYGGIAYVMFRDGGLRKFGLDGKYLGNYSK